MLGETHQMDQLNRHALQGRRGRAGAGCGSQDWRHDKQDRLARARSACLQPASCNRSPNHLVSMQMPCRHPANEWRSARERHGQNGIMPGVRRYDLS
jgi:hypothetical protein